MDLPLCLEALGIVENVSPDLSSYQAMKATWRGSMACPTEAALLAVWSAIEAALALEGIDEARRQAYPAIGDQLDAIWKQFNQDRLDGKAMIQETDDLLGQILAVKAAHPKV